MPSRIVQIALLMMLATRPAVAQQAAGGGGPPLLGLPPGGSPPSEIGLGTSQVLLGALTTLGAGLGLAFFAGEARSVPLAFIAVAASPGIGGAVVCNLGQSSPWYEGGCAPTIIGGYVGALILAVPLAYLGAAAYAPSDPDGGREPEVGAALGAALGLVIGAAVGATIGWHASKHRRSSPATAVPVDAPAPPADSVTSAEVRARSLAPAGVAFSVPLLSLRF
jgi:hypothetical protein